jgi:hypothetical protein
LVKITPKGRVSGAVRSAASSTAAVDVLMSSKGSLAINFLRIQDPISFVNRIGQEDLVSGGTMLDVARRMADESRLLKLQEHQPEDIAQLLKNCLNPQLEASYSLDQNMRLVSEWLQQFPEYIRTIVSPFAAKLHLMPPTSVGRFFYIVSQVEHESAAEVIVQFGLSSSHEGVAASAILSTHHATQHTMEMLQKLVSLSSTVSRGQEEGQCLAPNLLIHLFINPLPPSPS